MKNTKQKSHLGLGVMIGTAIGVAAAVFMQSKQGEKTLKVLDQKAAVLQAKLARRLKNAEKMTKAKYAALVDEVTEYYVKSKDVTKKEVPEIKRYLMRKWKGIEKQLKTK